jgi:membrane-associated two-gene conflict system component 1 (EACC1)
VSVQLKLEGTDAIEDTIFDLQDWINRERMRGVRAERESIPPKPGEMAAELAAVISIAGPIVAPVLVEVVKSVFGWLKMRRPKAIIKMVVGTNIIEIDTENLSDEQQIQIIERVSVLADQLGR